LLFGVCLCWGFFWVGFGGFWVGWVGGGGVFVLCFLCCCLGGGGFGLRLFFGGGVWLGVGFFRVWLFWLVFFFVLCWGFVLVGFGFFCLVGFFGFCVCCLVFCFFFWVGGGLRQRPHVLNEALLSGGSMDENLVETTIGPSARKRHPTSPNKLHLNGAEKKTGKSNRPGPQKDNPHPTQ